MPVGLALPSSGSSFDPFTPAPVKKPKPTDPLTDQYKLYNTSVEQQAGDYSNLMDQYKNLYASTAAKTNNMGTYNPEMYNYSASPNLTGAISNLGDLSKTGGYSDQDLANIRARSISPIRAVYANANRDIERNRTLKGGYSPGYAAVKARMARDLSSQLADASTNVEGDIASRVAQGRLTAAPEYASAAGSESALRNQYGAANADRANEASRFNLQLPFQNVGQLTSILDSMRSLYGTTPALSALYGGQALDSAQLQNLINQQNKNSNLGILQTLTSAYR